MSDPIILSADAIVPMHDNRLLRDAGVVVQAGVIATVGPLSELRSRFGELSRTHIPGVMLPGLINAHTHLELSYQTATGAPTQFTQWVGALMKNYPAPEKLQATIAAAVQSGIQKSLQAGVTTVGDISRQCQISRPLVATSQLRAVSFGEVTGLGKMRQRADAMLDQAADTACQNDHLTTGLSPHAPYTVEAPVLQKIIARALAQKLPLTMHLAELPGEEQFLRDCSGPLGKEWDVMLKLDILDNAIPTFDGSAIQWAHHLGLLDAAREVPVLLAHVNYASDADLKLLANSQASVVYCPRTRQFFGHDQVTPHRYRDMLDAGINVCLGTDSLASNPDLSPLHEAKLLHERDHLPATLAMEMITSRPAKALRLRAGTLAKGFLADLAVFPLEILPGDNSDALLSRLIKVSPSAARTFMATTSVPMSF